MTVLSIKMQLTLILRQTVHQSVSELRSIENAQSSLLSIYVMVMNFWSWLVYKNQQTNSLLQFDQQLCVKMQFTFVLLTAVILQLGATSSPIESPPGKYIKPQGKGQLTSARVTNSLASANLLCLKY